MSNNELLRPEEILSAQFENSPDIICILDRDLRVLKINRSISGEPCVGAPPGMDVCNVLPLLHNDAVRMAIQGCFETGRTECIEHPMPEGRWFSSRIAPIRRGGHTTHVMLISADNTEHRRAEAALRESERKLREITSNMGEGLYVLDTDGRVSFMNPAAERILGWSKEELAGRSFHDTIHNRRSDGSRLPLPECPILKVFEENRQFVSDDEVFVRKDGSTFPVFVTASPLIEDGQRRAVVAVFSDITWRKQLDQQLSRSRTLESVGNLAGGIAHDFNNLLQAILGYITIAGMTMPVGHESIEKLQKAEEAVTRARELSSRLLTFSKGGMPAKKITALDTLLRHAAESAFKGANISCEFDMPMGLYRVEVDEEQIRQVMSNLLKNAREAMPDGGVVKISAENVSPDDKIGMHGSGRGYVKVSVSDCGKGIPPENLNRIFDPYFTTKDMVDGKGTGLGLSICHSIIKKHDGFITVSSGIEKGSTFSVYLPLADRRIKVVPQRTEATSAVKTILFMDDDDVVCSLMTHIIETLGYVVEVAGSGEKAVKLYKRRLEAGCPFDLVILDLTVRDGMGGEMTMQRLQELDPHVRAVISSGYADDPVLRDFVPHGFIASIAKPYRKEELEALLKRIFP